MTDEPRALSVVPDSVSDSARERSMSRLMPRNLQELFFFADHASKSGLFKTSAGSGRGMRNITGEEAFLLMSQGVELGLSPLQSLRELNIIDGRVDVPASVRAARISASPNVERWDAVATKTECTITAKRRDRANHASVTVRLSDMNEVDITRHKNHIEDWLYARAVRKISRRYFPDLILGLDGSDDYDPERIIDVTRVEAALEPEAGEKTWPCNTCDGRMTLEANRSGGAYLCCIKCGATDPPPQEVRDLIRGTPEALTIAAANREEVMPPANVVGPATTIERDDAEPPADVTPPPSDEPEGARENDGGAFDFVAGDEWRDDIPADAAMIQWRARSRSAISKYLGEHRTPETGREHSLSALKAAGWDELSGVTLAAFLRDASDETIATLVGAFAIDVP